MKIRKPLVTSIWLPRNIYIQIENMETEEAKHTTTAHTRHLPSPRTHAISLHACVFVFVHSDRHDGPQDLCVFGNDRICEIRISFASSNKQNYKVTNA